jgi:hypothetical protein
VVSPRLIVEVVFEEVGNVEVVFEGVGVSVVIVVDVVAGVETDAVRSRIEC